MNVSEMSATVEDVEGTFTVTLTATPEEQSESTSSSGNESPTSIVYAYHTDKRTIGTSTVTDGVSDYTELSSWTNGKTWFLKYELDGSNVIQNAWACQKFSFINEQVCLQGGDASYYGTSSTGNRGIIEDLASTFTSNGGFCSTADYASDCYADVLGVGADPSGIAGASDISTEENC